MGCHVFAFANQKGGVGKTTCCVNLAASLSLTKHKVLLCDLDPQGNATMSSGVDKTAVEFSMNEWLLGTCETEAVLIEQTPAGYDLIPSNSDLTAAEANLVKKQGQQLALSKKLEALKDKYDYIFLDCPPSLNMLTVNALVASDMVVIAMQCEYFALEGLTDLVNTIKQLQSSLNPRLQIGGIIRTMFDSRNRLAIEVSNQLIDHFANKVFQTVIPRNVRLAEAPSYGLPVCLYDKSSRGASSYFALAGEFARKFKRTKVATKTINKQKEKLVEN